MTEASKRRCPLCTLTIKQCWGYTDAEEMQEQERKEINNADVARRIYGDGFARERHIEPDAQKASGIEGTNEPRDESGESDGDDGPG